MSQTPSVASLVHISVAADHSTVAASEPANT